MSNTVPPIRPQLARGSFTTGCAVATIGILVCGFVAASIEASDVQSEVRVVQLASLNGPTANPLGVLVGTLPAAAAAAATAAPVAPRPTGVSTDVPTSVEPLVDPEPAAAIAQVAEASDGGMTVGQWVVMAVIQSVAAIGRLFPEDDPIRLFFAAFVLFGTFLGAGIVAPFIDSVVNLVLWPFGLGTAAAAPLAAVGPIESNGETSTSDTVETTDRVNGDIAKFTELEPGSEKAAAPVGTESADLPTDPEATLSEQVSAERTEPMAATAAVDVVEVEPAAAEEVAVEPETAVREEVATDTVDPADDVTEAVEPEAESPEPETTTETDTTEAESTTAQDESTAEAGDPAASSDLATAEKTSTASSSTGSESSGDTAGSA